MVGKKKQVIQMMICVFLTVIIWGVYWWGMSRLELQIEPCADDFSWVHQVDSVTRKDGKLVLQGFAFELDVDSVGKNYEIVLQSLDTRENHFLKMEYSERKDVNDYFLCEYDYLKSGYQASVSEDRLDLQEKDYEVLLRMKGRKKAYQTGTYLVDGLLTYENPLEFLPPEVGGTDLEKIVKDGKLRVYQPDYGVYVYQYQGSFVWIADRKGEFIEYADTKAEYHAYTTQVKQLPQGRYLERLLWDDLCFSFRDFEQEKYNVDKYRVAIRKIPTEYSIKSVLVGNYAKDWLWSSYFRPIYFETEGK